MLIKTTQFKSKYREFLKIVYFWGFKFIKNQIKQPLIYLENAIKNIPPDVEKL